MKPSDITRMVDDYAGTRGSAQNALRALKHTLRWAVARDYLPPSLLMVTPEEGVPTRDRVLSVDELKPVLPVLRKGQTPYAAAMLFMLLTLSRWEEAAGAQSVRNQLR